MLKSLNRSLKVQKIMSSTETPESTTQRVAYLKITTVHSIKIDCGSWLINIYVAEGAKNITYIITKRK